MRRYRYLLLDLVSRDVKTKYRRSVLGLLWSILNPLLMMLVLTAVFSNIIRVQVEGGFALFYLTGYLMFTFISEATSVSMMSIAYAAPLIKKVYLPKYIFPLEKCIFSLVNMLFSLIAFVIVFVVFAAMGKITPSFAMLLFPLPMIYVFLFAFGISLILSAAYIFFRDLAHIYSVILTVWMYASPIIYPVDILPAWLASVMRFNPLYHYITYFRDVMIYGRVPSLYENLICILFSVLFLALGILCFRKAQDKFVLYI
ncbi:MAG: ABC transporter permease [Clostridia bacterium]|nr:ABC transporter permease [Clostridia bacterium]